MSCGYFSMGTVRGLKTYLLLADTDIRTYYYWVGKLFHRTNFVNPWVFKSKYKTYSNILIHVQQHIAHQHHSGTLLSKGKRLCCRLHAKPSEYFTVQRFSAGKHWQFFVDLLISSYPNIH